MPFLYSYAYDYASGLVHPMANDGEDDFARLTRGQSKSNLDPRMIINNSILIQSLILQEGLNASRYHWRAIIYNFIDQCRKSLGSNEKEHIKILGDLIKAGFEFEWCQIPLSDKS